jgi:exodeoxyribonuclease V alpha subunit
MAIEEIITRRLLSGIKATPLVQERLKALVHSAKQGHLCDAIEESSWIPKALWSEGDKATPLVAHNQKLYLQKNWALESLLLNKLLSFSTFPSDFSAQIPLHLQPAQKSAILKALGQKCAIFTGGPGTGKTFTASCFIRILAENSTTPYKVAIAAPTGKAAAHLEAALRSQGPLPSSLQVESTTLHRLLKLGPSTQRLIEKYEISADLVVVDEASMLDTLLMLHLFNAIGPNTRLLLLGDPDQLPPIEGGGLFADMAELIGSKLERSMRTDDHGLLALASNIKRGTDLSIPLVPCELFTSSLHKKVPNPIYSTAPDPAQCLQSHSSSRILTALRQGPYGADALNQQLLAHFQQKARPDEWIALPILITQNDPNRHLYNGTTGVLIRKNAYFLGTDGIRSFPEATLPHYEIAFCLSVHKSQGSEFDEVFALFPPGSELFGKEALYTAVTRARKKVTLISDDITVKALLSLSSRTRSGFKERFLSKLERLNRG